MDDETISLDRSVEIADFTKAVGSLIRITFTAYEGVVAAGALHAMILAMAYDEYPDGVEGILRRGFETSRAQMRTN